MSPTDDKEDVIFGSPMPSFVPATLTPTPLKSSSITPRSQESSQDVNNADSENMGTPRNEESQPKRARDPENKDEEHERPKKKKKQEESSSSKPETQGVTTPLPRRRRRQLKKNEKKTIEDEK